MDTTGPSHRNHTFYAIAFVENIPVRKLASAFPQAQTSPHELRLPLGEGEVFGSPFGVLVFRNVRV